MKTGAPDSQLRTLERALQILSLFDVESPHWSFVDVCQETALSKATVFRFLKKLEALRYLSYDAQKRTYHLGEGLLRVAFLASSYSEVVRVAHPHLDRLASETGEAVNLALRTAQGLLIVDVVFAPNAFRPQLTVGVTLHGLATTHGKLFAAYASEAERLNALLGPHEPLTEYTVTDPRILAKILADVRSEGVAFTQEEWRLSVCGIGCPVFDAFGQVNATIAIVVPKERFGPEDRRRYAEIGKEAAVRLTRELGGCPPAEAR